MNNNSHNGRIMLNIISFFPGVSYLNIMAAGTFYFFFLNTRDNKTSYHPTFWEGAEGHYIFFDRSLFF